MHRMCKCNSTAFGLWKSDKNVINVSFFLAVFVQPILSWQQNWLQEKRFPLEIYARIFGWLMFVHMWA